MLIGEAGADWWSRARATSRRSGTASSSMVAPTRSTGTGRCQTPFMTHLSCVLVGETEFLERGVSEADYPGGCRTDAREFVRLGSALTQLKRKHHG